jgi:hypothetical protein
LSTEEFTFKDRHTTRIDVANILTSVVASLRGVAVDGKTPNLEKAYFVSPDAAIFGEVSLDTGVKR